MWRVLGVAVSAVIAFSASPTRAVTIDFEGLAGTAAGVAGQVALTGLPGNPSDNSYSESGYTFTTSSTTNNLAIHGTLSPDYFGSIALWNGDGSGTASTTLTRNGGGAFDLLSIDIAELRLNGGPATVQFTGTFSGGGTVTQSFTTDGVRATGDVGSFQTVQLSGFNNVVSVKWFQPSTNFHQFDNVTVAAVPAPAALPLVGFGLVALGLAARRRLAKR